MGLDTNRTKDSGLSPGAALPLDSSAPVYSTNNSILTNIGVAGTAPSGMAYDTGAFHESPGVQAFLTTIAPPDPIASGTVSLAGLAFVLERTRRPR